MANKLFRFQKPVQPEQRVSSEGPAGTKEEKLETFAQKLQTIYSNTYTLEYSHWDWVFQKCSKRSKQRVVDYQVAEEELEKKFDIVQIQKQLNDLDLIKKILFSEDKGQLLRIMKKPTIVFDYDQKQADLKREKLNAKDESIFHGKMKLKEVDDAQNLYESYKAKLEDFKDTR